MVDFSESIAGIDVPVISHENGSFQVSPGQDTALVGMLNVFMESKGLITPQAWRQFCRETVPLLRMKKYTWTTDETFIGRVQFAHYGPADLPDARVTWTVTDSGGRKVAGDAFDPVTIEQGKVFEVDMFSLPLADIAIPQKLTITLAVEGTKYRNDYDIWVYPPKVDAGAPSGVLVADSFTAPPTQKHLDVGGKVLLLPKLDQLPHSLLQYTGSQKFAPKAEINGELLKKLLPGDIQ